MAQTKNQKTDFIEYLKKEYPLKQEDIDYNKKDVLETTKLKKVLDIFVKEEQASNNKIIDSQLIESWQKATEKEKARVLNEFLQKQRFLKKDLDKTLEKLNRKIDIKANTFIKADWKEILVTVCFLAFFLSTLIVKFFPQTADKIISFSKVNYDLAESIEVKQFEKVSKNELGQFVKNNSKYIEKNRGDKPYSLAVSVDEIKGRVAGVSEQVKVPQINIATSDTHEFEGIEKKPSFLKVFVDTQVKLAEKIKDLIK